MSSADPLGEDGRSGGYGRSGAQGQAELVETLARLAGRLPGGHARAWAAVLREWPHPDRAGLAAALISVRSGYGLASRAEEVVRAWRASPHTSGEAAAMALLAAAAVAERAEDTRAEAVVTGPSSPQQPTRLTAAAVSQLIRGARTELLIVSFAAYKAPGLVAELAAAADRGVAVDLVLEDSTSAAAAFAALRGKAGFWHWPVSRRGAGGAASLHAKVLAADQRTALIGSANLTGHAFNENIEVGVLLHDPATVRRVVGHFRALMREDAGCLAPLLRGENSGADG